MKTLRSNDGFVSIILTIIITAFLVGGGVYYYQWQEGQKQTQQVVKQLSDQASQEIDELKKEITDLKQELTLKAENEKTSLSDWQTYTDDELGLYFKYPNDFSQTEDSELFGKLFKSSDGHFWLKVSDNSKNVKTIQDIKEDYYANDSYGYKYEDNFIKINGIDIYKQGRYDLGTIENHYFLNNNKLISLSFEFNHNNQDKALQDKYKILISDIVNSINNISDWQTYKNSWDVNYSGPGGQLAFDFQFKYPNNLKVDGDNLYRFIRENNSEYDFLVRISAQTKGAFEKYKKDQNKPNVLLDDFIVNLTMNSCEADGVGGSRYCKEAMIYEQGVSKNGIRYFVLSMKEVTSYSDNRPNQEISRGPVYILDIKEQTNDEYELLFFSPESNGLTYSGLADILKGIVDSFSF